MTDVLFLAVTEEPFLSSFATVKIWCVFFFFFHPKWGESCVFVDSHGELEGAAVRGVRHQKRSQPVRLEAQSRTQFSGNLQHKICDNKKPVGVSSLLIFFFFKLILMLQ